MNNEAIVGTQQPFQFINKILNHQKLVLVGVFVFLFGGFLFLASWQASSAQAAISYVGSASGSGTASTYNVAINSLTGGSNSAPSEGDLVIVVTGWASTTNGDPGVTTSGYTEVNAVDYYSNDTRDANMSVNYKFMGASPDTSVTVRGTNAAGNGGATVVHVWRGVDLSSPLDVTSTTATGTNAANANSPSITPTTSGAYVIAAGLGTGDTTPTAKTGPSGMSNFRTQNGTGTTMSAIAGVASFAWTSGAYDPAAWTGGESTTSDSWAAMSLVLRPQQYITIQGTCKAFDESTNCSDGAGTIKAAVNGTLNSTNVQADESGGGDGDWSITNFPKPASSASIIIFIDGAATGDRATAVTIYDGSGDITNVRLFKEHVSIGNDTGSANTPPSAIGTTVLDDYDYSVAGNDADLIYDIMSAGTCEGQGSFTGLCLDAANNSSTEELLVLPLGGLTPATNIRTHDIDIRGTFTGNGNTYTVSGSWNDTGTFTPATSTVTFISTSTGETITTTGSTFTNITFNGSGGGWTLQDSTTVSGSFTITTGNFNAGSATITLSGLTPFLNNGTFTYGTSTIVYTADSASQFITAANMSNSSGGTNGYYNLEIKPSGTNAAGLGTDVSQTIGVANNLVIGNGTNAGATALLNNPTISVAGNVTIANNATFVSTSGNFSVGGNWSLGATAAVFTASSGTVTFTATDTGNTISGDMAGSNAFYNLIFNGSGGDWYVSSAHDLRVTNTLTVTAGTFKGVSSGAYNVYVNNGLVGNGIINTTGLDGNFVVDGSIGGNSAWIFSNALALQNLSGGNYTSTGSGDITIQGGLALVSGTFNAGSRNWILAKPSGTPFTESGVFNAQTSTFRYTGDGAIPIALTDYYNLESKPTTAVTHTIAGPGTLTVANDFIIGAGGVASTVNAETNDPVIDVNRDFTINSSAVFSASSSSAFTIARNFTNSGTFTANTGTVNLDSATTAVVAGSASTETTFRNLTINTAGKTVQFTSTHKFGVVSGGVFTTTGTNGNNVVITSTTGNSQWIMNHQGTESNTYTTVSWSGCETSPASTQIDMTGTGNTNGNNNGTCWYFGVTGVTISGVVYQQDGSTPDTTGYTIIISTGGGTTTQTTSNGSGVWAFTSYGPPSAGNNLFIWKSGGGGTLVLKYGTTGCSGGNCTGLSLVANRVTIQNAHTGSITNSDLGQCDPDSGLGCSTTDVGYSVDPSDNLSIDDGIMLSLSANTTFTPGGTVTTSPAAQSGSNDGDVLTASGSVLDMGTNALSIGGDFGMFGSMTFSSGQTTTFTAVTNGIGLNVAGGTFENVVFDGVDGGWAFSQDKTMNGDLTVTNGSLSGTFNINVNGGDVTGNGSITLTGGTVTVNGAGSFGGNTAWILNALSLTGASSSTTGAGSGSITVTANDGALTIGSSHTFVSNNKTVILSGTGTPLVATGVLNATGSTFRYTGNGATITSSSNGGSSISYHILEAQPGGATPQTLGTASGHTINISSVFVVGNNTNAGATGDTNDPTVNAAYLEVRNNATLVTGSGTYSFSGCVNNSFDRKTAGVFTASSGNTVKFTCTNTTGQTNILSTAMTGSNAFYNLTIDGDGGGDNFSLGQVTTVSNDFTVSAGDNLINTDGTVNLTVGGVVGGTGVINLSNGTFTHNMVGTKNFGDSGNWTFNNLTFDKNGVSGAVTANGAGSVTVNGTLTVASGTTLNAGSKTYILNATGSPFSLSGTFNYNTSTFSYRNTTSASTLGNITYYNLDFSPASGTPTYTVGQSANLSVAGDFTIGGAGNAIVNAGGIASYLSVGGNVTIGTGDTLQAPANATNLYVSGSWANSGTFTHNSGTVYFDSTDAANIDPGSSSFHNATFNHATGDWTLTNNMTVANVLTLTNGNLDANSRIITLSASGTPFVKSGGTFEHGTSTVNYTGTSATNVLALNGASTTDAYYNLGLGTTSDVSAVTYTSAGSTTVNGTITIGNAGSTGVDYLALGATTLTLKGNGTPLSPVSGKGGVLSETSTVQYTSGSGVAALSSVIGNFNNLVINGTGTFNIGVNLAIGGDLTVTSGTLSGTNSVEVQGGDVTGNGIINMSGSSVFAAWGTGNFGGDSNWTFNQLQISEEPGWTITSTGSGSITTATLVLNGTLNAGSKTWTITGTGTPFTNGGGTLNTQTSTFNFTGAGATNIPAYTYNNLGIKPGANSATHTMGTAGSQAFVVGGTLTVGNGTNTGVIVTAATWNPTIDVNGTSTAVDIKAGTTFTAPANTFTVAGNWINAGTFNSSGATVTFDASSGSKTITTGGSSFGSLTLGGAATFTPQDSVTITANLNANNGTLAGTQNINVAGNVSGSGDINLTGGTMTLTGTGIFSSDTNWDLNNITTGNSATVYGQGSGTVTIAGVLTLGASSQFNAGAKNWIMTGSGTPISFGALANFNAETSKVTYSSASGITALSNVAMVDADKFYDLEINSAGDTFTAGVTFQIYNSLEVLAGTLAVGNNAMTICDPSQTESNESCSIKVTPGASLTQSANANTILNSSKGDNCIGGPSAQCGGVSGAGTITLGDVQLNSGGAYTINGIGVAVTMDTLDITSATFALGGGGTTLSLTGNGEVIIGLGGGGGVLNTENGKVVYNSTSTTGTTIADATYYDLEVNRASNTFTAPSNLAVGNTFVITAGTFVAPSGSLQITTAFTNDGTFTHNNGTVTLTPPTNGTVNINGSSNTTFYNFSNTVPRNTMRFANGRTYSFNGTFTVAGTNGNPVKILSDSAGLQWFIDINGSASVSYAIVQDSGCSSSANISTTNKVYNYGNNGTCWKFITRGTFGPSEGGPGSGGAGGGGGGAGGGGSVQATATATIQSGSVNGTEITQGGSGYTLVPLVCFLGGSPSVNATGTANISGGAVISITITLAGTGYQSAPSVSIGAPGSSGGTCGSGGGGGGSGGGGGGAP